MGASFYRVIEASSDGARLEKKLDCQIIGNFDCLDVWTFFLKEYEQGIDVMKPVLRVI